MLLTGSRPFFVLAAAVLLSGCSEEQSSFGADQPAVDACIEALEEERLVPEGGVTRSLSVASREDGWDVRYEVEDGRSGDVSLLGCSVARDSSAPLEVGAVSLRRS